MAWKETTAMEQKIEFITEWRSGAYSITELSHRGIDILIKSINKKIEQMPKRWTI